MTGHPQAVAERPVNGHPVTVPVMLLPSGHGPSEPWPPQPATAAPQEPSPSPSTLDAAPAAGPSPSRLAALAPSWRWPDGDTVITWAMAATVALVALDAAIVSYSHIYGLATGQPGSGAETGIQARLLPLSIDGVIAEASLVKLYAARHKVARRARLSTFMLWLGIVATVAANVTHGLPSSLLPHDAHVVIMALLSAWPAGAFIGSVEMAMGLVRSMRDVASAGVPDGLAAPVTPPSPEAPSAIVTPSPGPPSAAVKPAAPRPVKPTREPPARPAKAPVKGAPASDGKIAAALTANPSLADASIPVMAKAAGVSESSVERYRRRQRDGAAS